MAAKTQLSPYLSQYGYTLGIVFHHIYLSMGIHWELCSCIACTDIYNAISIEDILKCEKYNIAKSQFDLDIVITKTLTKYVYGIVDIRNHLITVISQNRQKIII